MKNFYYIPYFITLILLINLIDSKKLSSENCDRVSEELSAQGVTFEEKFQLNTLSTKDLLCLNPSKEGKIFSCCNRIIENNLLEMATSEYREIFTNEMKTLSNTLKKINVDILNISIQIIVEFGVKLEASTSIWSNSNETNQDNQGIIRRLVSILNSFLLSSSSEKTVYTKVRGYINQFVGSFSLSNCGGTSHDNIHITKRKKRHWSKLNIKRLNGIASVQGRQNLKKPEEEINLSKDIRTLIRGLNSTRLFLQVFNTSVEILNRVSKCHKCILPEDCSTNVMRMNHCSYCAGEALSRPCFSVCLQVISGCIWKLQSLSKDWKSLFALTEKYFSKKRNQERLINNFAGLYVSIRGVVKRMYGQNTKEGCSFEQNDLHIYPKTLRAESRNIATHSSYDARQIKMFWENLAVTMCTRSTWLSSLSNNQHCWNGSTITSPQWHKCSFCQDKRQKHGSVPRIVAQSVKDMISLFLDVSWIMTSISKYSQKTLKFTSQDSKEELIFNQSELSVKGTEETLKKYKAKNNKSVWKDLGKNNFIIFDDVDSANNGEEGSGKYVTSDRMKYVTRVRLEKTPQSFQSGQSLQTTPFITLAVSMFTYFSFTLEGALKL